MGAQGHCWHAPPARSPSFILRLPPETRTSHLPLASFQPCRRLWCDDVSRPGKQPHESCFQLPAGDGKDRKYPEGEHWNVIIVCTALLLRSRKENESSWDSKKWERKELNVALICYHWPKTCAYLRLGKYIQFRTCTLQLLFIFTQNILSINIRLNGKLKLLRTCSMPGFVQDAFHIFLI